MPGFTDRGVVALAAATALGAWVGIVAARAAAGAATGAAGRGDAFATFATGGPGPVVVALAAAGLALALARPVVLCLALAVLAATLAQRSLDGLRPPALGAVRAEVTLLGDPAPTAGGGVRVDVRLDGKRLAASAHRAAAAALDDRLAGERVLVVGTVARPGPYEERVLHRHLAGRLRIDVVAGWQPGDGVSRLANGMRRTLDAGAASLAPRPRALMMGLVLGDDRAQSADLADAFRAAGLAHLTAVSGQNVAFVLLLVRPLLVRLRFAPRLLVALAALAGFALLTRFEPSVLRATVMAGIGAFGAAVGRPSSGLRRLALAVTGLLLVDPLLVSSLGFRLSVAGAAGIIVAAAPVERCLPGPRWLAAPLAVTGAAQLAVAPLLVQSFGSVGLVSLPANLLAGPAAGPVMMWGLTAGLAAGVLGGSAAALLHLPNRLLLAWIEGVATAAASRPLGLLEAGHVAGLLVAAALAGLAVHLRRRATRALVASLVADAGVGAGAGGGVGGEAAGALVAGDRASSATVEAGTIGGPAGRGGPRVGGRPVSDLAPAAERWSRRAPDEGPWRVPGAAAGALRWVAAVVAVGTLVAAIAGGGPPGAPTAGPTPVAPGAVLWRAGGAGVVVIDGRTTDDGLLSGLRSAGAGRIDLLVVRTTAVRALAVAARARQRWPSLVVLAPRGAEGLDGALAPPTGSTVDVGPLRLRFEASADRLEPTIGPAGPAGRPP
jgi:competence protein ComEC